MRRLTILLVFLLVACGTPDTAAPPAPASVAPTANVSDNDPCAPAALQSYRGTYNNIMDRWGRAVIEAGQTQAENLQSPLAQLQALLGELAALTPPECARQAHDNSLQAMRRTIEGYQSLMAQKDIGKMLSEAIDMLSLAQAQVGALPGTLPPTPTALPTFTPIPSLTPTLAATSTPTPTLTPTPQPRQGYMGKQAQLYESPTSTVPIKTIFKGTRVEVFETQKGRTHIRTQSVEGWVSQNAVVIP